MELVFTPATKLVAQIKARQLTVVEVVRAFLDHIAQHNAALNPVIDLRERAEVLAEAEEKDRALDRGDAVGLLHGLPMTVKDSYLVRGLKNSNGDPLLRHYRAEEDAELVRRLKCEGAIILGKTNCALFCIDWQSTNFWNGQTNNPYDPSRVAGGSSGGSAVAVAAGFSPLELGADAGGSVRVPAHFNGICGLRPTENLLSNRGHLKAPNRPQGRRHIVTPGPFAKNVEDLKLLMRVLGDNAQHRLPELHASRFDEGPVWDGKPLAIGYAPTLNGVPVDQEYAALFAAFLAKLKDSPHHLKADQPRYDEQAAYVTYNKILGFEMGVNNPKFPLMSAGLYAFIRLKYRDHSWAKGMARGLRMSNAGYAKAIDEKDQFSAIYDGFLTEYDVWITPVCAMEAYTHQKAGKPFAINGQKVGYTEALATFNFTTAFSGHPIAVIPIGRKQNGLPVGIQIHARKWSDRRMLDIAQHLESFTDGFQVPEMMQTAPA